jgi:hypothetical protein
MPLGTKVTNRADIYFDYNIPVPTNTTLNLRTDDVGVNPGTEIIFGAGISIYPNPSNTILNIQSQNLDITEFSIIDLKGTIILKQKTEGIKTISLPMQDIANGIYFVKLETANQSLTKKIIIRH